MDFDLWIPAKSAKRRRKQYPLVIYLHGFCGRKDPREGLRGLVADSPAFGKNFIVLVPKAPKDYYWFHKGAHAGYNNEVSLDVLHAFRALLQEVLASCPVDRTRVTLVGTSMGGFGALTYMQHCGDFITSLVLLGAHFDGTGESRFFDKVYKYGLEMDTFDAIIENCKKRNVRTWILHGTRDKTCSYTDMLLFFHVCAKNGYDQIGLQIDGVNHKPLKSHHGPYEWMFGEARLQYSPNPLGAFCAHPQKYDDSEDFLRATRGPCTPGAQGLTKSSRRRFLARKKENIRRITPVENEQKSDDPCQKHKKNNGGNRGWCFEKPSLYSYYSIYRYICIFIYICRSVMV
eukprot:GEMP01054958.1.p1 GENE.GEMP01054958.1~~GEMP01054958.1.p1  ORF type:complete len:345 (+),score=30.64 GEMP01054958.1:294-1328(+)